MAQWGRNDQSVTANSTTTVETSNGAPIGTWALVKGDQVNRVDGANAHFGNTSSGSRASVDVAMFGNTTANAFILGKAVGVFGLDAQEVQASPEAGVAHAGWVLRTEGTGGRAGRVQIETLVAMGSLGAQTAAYGTPALVADASDDVTAPDYTIRVSTQPINTTINATSNVNNTAVLFTVAATQPTGGTITYLWQANTGSGFVNAAAGTTGNTTANLTVYANSFSTGAQFRVLLRATGAANVTTSVASVTINT